MDAVDEAHLAAGADGGEGDVRVDGARAEVHVGRGGHGDRAVVGEQHAEPGALRGHRGEVHHRHVTGLAVDREAEAFGRVEDVASERDAGVDPTQRCTTAGGGERAGTPSDPRSSAITWTLPWTLLTKHTRPSVPTLAAATFGSMVPGRS